MYYRRPEEDTEHPALLPSPYSPHPPKTLSSLELELPVSLLDYWAKQVSAILLLRFPSHSAWVTGSILRDLSSGHQVIHAASVLTHHAASPDPHSTALEKWPKLHAICHVGKVQTILWMLPCGYVGLWEAGWSQKQDSALKQHSSLRWLQAHV